MSVIYNSLLYLLVPFILVRLLYRSLSNPNYRKRIPERFGFYKKSPQPGGIWVHAVSVGEAITAVRLIRALQERYRDREFIVTCGTPTGSEIIQTQLGESVVHVYAPYDLPGAVRRFVHSMQPALGIVMETEIWPNLFRRVSASGAVLMISNMRLSPTSFRRYRRFPRLTAASLNRVDRIAAQTQADADRAIALGAEPQRVEVVGNLKFEMAEQNRRDKVLSNRLRQALDARNAVWLAGSTHEGEDEIVLNVHETLLKAHPELLLILVPRHPERFERVFQLCCERFKTQRRSELGEEEGIRPDTQVLLIDSIGELSRFIALSDWAFIGGSLVPVGGHNILEACQAGVPVIFGEHMFNFEEIAKIVLKEGAGTRVNDESTLLAICSKLADQPALRRQQAKNGLSLVNRNRGALEKTLNMIDELMDGRD